MAAARLRCEVKRWAKDETTRVRLALRQQYAVPVLASLQEEVLGWQRQLSPKHPMAEAVNYALGRWEALNVSCRDGATPIDDNGSDREIKRIVLNRKNSLFVGHARRGQSTAILARLTSTCRRHGIGPQRYLRQLLVNLPATRRGQLGERLPDQ